MAERISHTGTVDPQLAAIISAMGKAKTKAQADAVARELAAYDAAHPAPSALAADSRVETLTWERAASWWPYRPLLRSVKPPRPRAQEEILAFTQAGGTKGDPRRQLAYLYVVYQVPPHTVDSDSYFGITDGGGVIIEEDFLPPDQAGQVNDFAPTTPHRTTTVRGHAANIVTYNRKDNNVDWRFIVWRDVENSGGVVRWTVGGSPKLYSEDDLISFVNNLRSV